MRAILEHFVINGYGISVSWLVMFVFMAVLYAKLWVSQRKSK